MKIETPILKRLGPIPFWRGEKRCLDSLETIYRRAMESAQSALTRGGARLTSSKAARSREG